MTGKLKDVACAKIDAQTEALISMIGENQVDYRFFIGFKLLVNEQEVTMKQFRREAKTAVSDFLHEVNHKLMGDFVSMSNEEIWRFQKMEKLLESKISRRFKVRRLDKDDFGYLIEHLYGQTGTAYEDYEYYLPKKHSPSWLNTRLFSIYLIGYAINITPYCRDGLCRRFLFQLHGLSCIGQFRAYQICQYGFQEAVRLLPVKGLLAHEPSEGKGYAEIFQKCPVNERKGREVPQEHNCKHRYHEPRHLCERDGEWQLKIIDGI